jgi:hypothetical protein
MCPLLHLQYIIISSSLLQEMEAMKWVWGKSTTESSPALFLSPEALLAVWPLTTSSLRECFISLCLQLPLPLSPHVHCLHISTSPPLSTTPRGCSSPVPSHSGASPIGAPMRSPLLQRCYQRERWREEGEVRGAQRSPRSRQRSSCGSFCPLTSKRNVCALAWWQPGRGTASVARPSYQWMACR